MAYHHPTRYETDQPYNPSAPPMMYPEPVTIHPAQKGFSSRSGQINETQMGLLPKPPPRADRPPPRSDQPPPRSDRPITRQSLEQAISEGLRRGDIEGDGGPSIHAHSELECGCNYNLYATKKTIGHGMLEFALLTSNAMQLRTLIIQKHRNVLWTVSIILVCVSILLQIGLGFLLVLIGKGDIRNPSKQTKLERLNNLSLFLILLISICNIVINVFMTTTNLSV
ncbi:unnamed protein product [Didymodactylos carnosus]|uniref:Uncharacterized protein n=1 Tax=Didymodactylos carnosus TaxID=1234261 RepID=A0A814LM98_9BILA|nr:unnamed protein product [Didymodactylos carnosus]CAF1067769.1 unnamed protein product [Didymodactylos carnosus]CAF3617087.1 unnamed protein product [Didymodactylos carnosus]CAF3835232.1 unnamed protein product [Didymodactylos carnosus]